MSRAIQTSDSTALITVIICCYNAGDTIGKTLETLRGQSWSNLELLVIDDGSTDDSYEIVRLITLTDPRVKVLENLGNKGTAFTRQRGLVEARTDLVMFFDADDLAEPELVSRLLSKLLEDDSIIGVGCYARYFSDARDLGIQRIGPTSKEAFFEHYRKNKLLFMNMVTLFYRQDALKVGGFKQDILPNGSGIRYEDFAEDLDLWCRMSDLGAKGRYFITIPEPLFRYRKPVGSISTRNLRLMQLKMRWIRDCLRRRRAGGAELSLTDFIDSRSWLDRINDYRSDLAAKFYKSAGFSYTERNYFKVVVFLVMTGIFSPKLIRQKIRTQTTRNIG